MREINTIVIHHSASKAGTFTWADIKKWHLAKGWQDIGYHMGIVNDTGSWGMVHGRPIEVIGAHCKGANATSIGVVFEGNYSVDELPEDAFELGVIWVSALMLEHSVTAQRLLPHRGAGTTITECPGTKFPWDRFHKAVSDKL